MLPAAAHFGEPLSFCLFWLDELEELWYNGVVRNLDMDEIIHHLAVFVSRLWQIHIFGEGNTRTTAVFFVFLFEPIDKYQYV